MIGLEYKKKIGARRFSKFVSVAVLCVLLSASLVAVPEPPTASAADINTPPAQVDTQDTPLTPAEQADLNVQSGDASEFETQPNGFAQPGEGSSEFASLTQDGEGGTQSAGAGEKPSAAHPHPYSTQTSPQEAQAQSEGTPMQEEYLDGDYVYTAELSVHGYTLLGATWGEKSKRGPAAEPGGEKVLVQTATQSEDVWSAYEDAIDDCSSTDGGTDAVLVNHEGNVRLQLVTRAHLDNPHVTLITPDVTPEDVQATAPKPKPLNMGMYPGIHSRYEWGADDNQMVIHDWPVEQTSYRGAVVHHTAGANNYSQAQVPGIIRSVFAYHASALGWGDIGYNFLVDKYGGIWEGRAGSIASQPVGGHAKHNANWTTFGVSVLGNYQEAPTTGPMLQALVDVISWKFNALGIDPHGGAEIGTEWGSAWLPTIVGHRDVGATACPGQYLYAQLGTIRNAVNRGSSPIGNFENLTKVDDTHIRVQGWAADPDVLGESISVHVYIGAPAGSRAKQAIGIPATQPRPDVQAALRAGHNAYGFDATIAVDASTAQSLWVYAINRAPTGGQNKLLGADAISMDDSKVPVMRATLRGVHFWTANRGEYKNLSQQGGNNAEGVAMIGLADSSAGVSVYRLVNSAGYHFFTVAPYERDSLVRQGWRLEGLAWYADPSRTIYRLRGSDHIYTNSLAEAVNLRTLGYIYEGKMIDGREMQLGHLSNGEPTNTLIPVHRLSNGFEHFYTTSEGEALSAGAARYRYEGIAFQGVTDPEAGSPVYRLSYAGEHFYTTNAYERDSVRRSGGVYEGVAWYQDPSVKVYRLVGKEHFYTSSVAEVMSAASAYRLEGTWNPDPVEHAPVYRLAFLGKHFYTTSLVELMSIARSIPSPRYEGVGWYTDNTGDVPVYRIVLPSGEHFWTTSVYERDLLRASGARYEGVAWKAGASEELPPVYRLVLTDGHHFFTASEGEKNALVASGSRLEGVGFRAV